MKKFILVMSLIGIVISCKPKQQLVTTTVDRKEQRSLKGEWTLMTVEYPGSNYFKITSFDVTDSKCFEGSSWVFVSNNDSGKLVLNSDTCMQYASDFKWYITKDNQLVLKLIKDGEKPRKVTSGYILTISNLTEESFQLTDVVQVGNNKAKVIYKFKKNYAIK